MNLQQGNQKEKIRQFYLLSRSSLSLCLCSRSLRLRISSGSNGSPSRSSMGTPSRSSGAPSRSSDFGCKHSFKRFRFNIVLPLSRLFNYINCINLENEVTQKYIFQLTDFFSTTSISQCIPYVTKTQQLVFLYKPSDQ